MLHGTYTAELRELLYPFYVMVYSVGKIYVAEKSFENSKKIEKAMLFLGSAYNVNRRALFCP